MNPEDRKQSNNWTEEERDRIVGFFDLLIKMDKKQNPDLYRTPKKAGLDKDENDAIL